MYNIRSIGNWAIFSILAIIIISYLAVSKDQVVALVLISYGHIFLSHMAEREYFRRRLKNYQKGLSTATALLRSTELRNTMLAAQLNSKYGYIDTDSINDECEK